MNQKEFSDLPGHPPPNASSHADSSIFLPWIPLAPGIWELHLNGGPLPTGSESSLTEERSVIQYYEPGTQSAMMQVITHDYIEEVIFMRGGLRDVTLGKEWGIGAYAYRLPGMEHGPYIANKETGVLQFIKCIPVKKGGDANIGGHI